MVVRGPGLSEGGGCGRVPAGQLWYPLSGFAQWRAGFFLPGSDPIARRTAAAGRRRVAAVILEPRVAWRSGLDGGVPPPRIRSLLVQRLEPARTWRQYEYSFDGRHENPGTLCSSSFRNETASPAEVLVDDVRSSASPTRSASVPRWSKSCGKLRPGYLRDWQGSWGIPSKTASLRPRAGGLPVTAPG